MKTIFKITLEEFRRIFRDWGVLLIFFIAIIIYPFFYPIPYSAEVLKDVPVGLVDQSNTSSSRNLVRMINANELVQVETRFSDMAAAKTALVDGRIGGILLIPRDFEIKVLRGEQAAVSAYCDSSYFLLYRQVLKGILTGSRTFSAGIEVKRMLAGGLMMENAVAGRDPLSLVSYPLFNPQGGYATYVVPAVLMILLQQTLLIGIGMLVGTERERIGKQLPPLGHPVQEVIGRSIAYYLIYLFHSIYLFGVLFRFYQFPSRANLLELLVFLTPFLFATIFLALAVAAFFKYREVSIIILLFSSILALFLTGFCWPKEAIPDVLKRLSLLLPSTAGVNGFLKLNQMGASLNDVSGDWLKLAVLCMAYFVLAVFSQWKTRNRLLVSSNRKSKAL